jgi:hypothetical protein
MSWLRTELGAYLRNESPELIFVHMMLPHPPLYLATDCDFRRDGGLSGLVVGIPDMEDSAVELRKRLYVDQVRCVATVLLDLAAQVDNRALLLAFGDHGPDSQGQLFMGTEDWTQTVIEERFGVFFATNESRCGLSSVRSLVNVGRRLLSCLGGLSAAPRPDRRFIEPGTLGSPGAPPGPLREISAPAVPDGS